MNIKDNHTILNEFFDNVEKTAKIVGVVTTIDYSESYGWSITFYQKVGDDKKYISSTQDYDKYCCIMDATKDLTNWYKEQLINRKNLFCPECKTDLGKVLKSVLCPNCGIKLVDLD